mmetsp:Transcript_11869/g.27593  ORF Transcript_11869/g.27593 Transcript_11869/m.27593 type:complete len:204 (-) Transcript_11869:86-697(-)
MLLLLAKLDSVVGDLQELDGLGAPHHAVRGDDHLALGVEDAACKRLSGEPPENDRMHRSDPRTCQHRYGQLDDHGQVDCHRIPLHDPAREQHVRHPLHLVQNLSVGKLVLLVVVAVPKVGNLVTVARFDVPVQAVVAHVCLPFEKPLDADVALLQVIVDLRACRPGLVPMETRRNLLPELIGLFDRPLVHLPVLRDRTDVGAL